MNQAYHLYKAETEKNVPRFVDDFIKLAQAKDFIINNEPTMNMKEAFTRHGSPVSQSFDLHMIQLCKPAKASKSLTANPERAVLMPKFVHVFSGQGKTQIRFLGHGPEQITDLVKDDPEFPESLSKTYKEIHSIIDQAL